VPKLSLLPALIFGLFWVGIVGAFDYVMLGQVWRQVQSMQYEETTGEITHSQVTEHRGSKGSRTHGVDIRYRYVVDGRNFESKRFRYDAWASSNAKWARETVTNHKIGTTVPVFYHPEDPSEAVLSKGINGMSLFAMMFLTPFNLIAVLLLSVPVKALISKIKDPIVGGVPILRQGSRTHVRLPSISPMAAALTALGFGSFVAVFVLAFGFSFTPSVTPAATTWVILLALALATYLRRQQTIRSGKEDLVLDESENVIHLPQTHGRKHPEQVPLNSVSGVDIVTVIKRSRKGGASRTYEIHFADGSRKVTEFHSEGEARIFGKWLAERLGVSFHEVTE
jgi:hypothetical protein